MAAAPPSTTVAARPNTIVAAPVYYADTNAGAPTPMLYPTPIPFAGHFPPLGPPPPWPYRAPFYPMGPPQAFPPLMPPGALPGPPVYPPPPPPPPGVPVDPRYITQSPVLPGPPGFPPSLTPPGVSSYQRPALIHGTVEPVSMDRLRFPPVAQPDIPHFKIYIGKIAPTVDNDFVLSLLQVCGVVKSWEPVTNPIDGSRTGFGFCVFESAEGSLRAKRLLNKLSVDGQELVLNVNQATRDYFQKYGESTSEGKTKEAETKTRDGVVSLADNGNDLSRAIPDVTARGAVGGQMSTKGEIERCQHGIEEYSDADKDAMQRIRSMIAERMKNKISVLSKKIEERMKNILPGSLTLAVQTSACTVDENVNDDARGSAPEERKIRRQCEKEEHLGERKAVGLEGQEGREVTAAGKSSLPIDEAPSMHVLMERESTVVHERSQHKERYGFRKNNGEENGRERKALGSEGQKEREVTAAGKSSLQTDKAPLIHVRMECEIRAEHERKSQRRDRIGFTKSNLEEKGRKKKTLGSEGQKDGEVTAAGKSSAQTGKAPWMNVLLECESTVEHERKSQRREIVFVPGLVSDKQNTSAGEKMGFELQATFISGDKKTLDAKQLVATVPKTKEELFAYDINWAIYDKYGLHERIRPWISKKATEVFDEELAEFVDYVVESIKEHVDAPRLLELLESLLDDDAEKFVLLMWRKLIFEIKRVEEGLA